MATSVKELGVRFNSSKTTADALANNTTDAGKGTIHFTTEGDIVLNGTNFTRGNSAVQTIKIGEDTQTNTGGVVVLPAYPTTLPASDVSAWAKSNTKPTYNAGEVKLSSNYAKPSSGSTDFTKGSTTVESAIGSLAKAVDGKQASLSFTGTPSSTNKVVTKDTLDAAVAGASNYLGTVTALTDLSTTAKKGDFYRVATAWSGVHVGDILIAEQNNPAAAVITSGTNGYTCLHNEMNTDTHDTNVAGTGIAVSGTRGNTIALSSDTQTSLANGATAYGWGNHASAGYLKSSDLASWAKSNTKPTYNAGEIKLSSNYAKASTGSTNFTGGTTIESAIASLAKAVDGKTSNTGTVTSVAVSVPTGLSVSGSPITSSGTIAISLASGYSIPTTVKQTAWDAKYSKPSGGIPETDLSADVQNALAITAQLIWD